MSSKGSENRTPFEEKKARREAEIGLAAERNGQIPPPVTRAEIDNSDPSAQKDQGDVVDGSGQRWDVKGYVDTFPGGPKAGQPMPPGMKGGFDINNIESQIERELSKGENVLLDTGGIVSERNLNDLYGLLDRRPEWGEKVLIVDF